MPRQSTGNSQSFIQTVNFGLQALILRFYDVRATQAGQKHIERIANTPEHAILAQIYTHVAIAI